MEVAADRSAQVLALPAHPADRGSIVLDARGEARVLRVTWHPEDGVVVLSLWRDDRCAATFRLAAEEVPVLVDALVGGLARSAGERLRAVPDAG